MGKWKEISDPSVAQNQTQNHSNPATFSSSAQQLLKYLVVLEMCQRNLATMANDYMAQNQFKIIEILKTKIYG